MKPSMAKDEAVDSKNAINRTSFLVDFINVIWISTNLVPSMNGGRLPS